MYRVSDGYNLDSNDKTYFDKYNIFDLISNSRSLTSPTVLDTNPSISTEKFKSVSAMRIVKKMT